MEFPIKSHSLRRWFVSVLGTREPTRRRTKVLAALCLFAISFAAKCLHSVDLAPLMYTMQQPFNGLAVGYDARAASILRGEGLLGPYNVDPSQTTWLSQAPGYSIFLSAIYKILGRDFFNVQLVQNAVNSLSPVLLFLIAGAVLGWRVGFASGLLAALSHHLSHISNFILPDSLCALPVLVAIYCLAGTRVSRSRSYLVYGLSGAMIGVSVWLRPQAMLLGVFAAGVFWLMSARSTAALKHAAVLAAGSLLLVAPITIRNYVVYHAFVPVNLGVGITLWEGIADASGDRFGAVATDDEVAAQEAVSYHDSRYAGSMFTPDGISRDRDRVAKSLTIIRRHPFWYAGVMIGRMKDMLKYSAHAPLIQGSASPKSPDAPATIRPEWVSISRNDRASTAGNALFWLRPVLRVAQRVVKETMLLFIIAGFLVTVAAAPRRALFIAIVPIYYLLFQSFVHTEFRYTLPMQYFVFVFAAVLWVMIWTMARRVVVQLRNRAS